MGRRGGGRGRGEAKCKGYNNLAPFYGFRAGAEIKILYMY